MLHSVCYGRYGDCAICIFGNIDCLGLVIGIIHISNLILIVVNRARDQRSRSQSRDAVIYFNIGIGEVLVNVINNICEYRIQIVRISCLVTPCGIRSGIATRICICSQILHSIRIANANRI